MKDKACETIRVDKVQFKKKKGEKLGSVETGFSSVVVYHKYIETTVTCGEAVRFLEIKLPHARCFRRETVFARAF